MASSFLSNQGTQSALLVDTTGGTAGTLIPVMKIDTSAQGTAGAIWGGSITGVGTLPGVGVVTSLTNGSINVPNGTLQALGTLGTLGTALGVGVVTTVTNVSNGTIQNSGTVTGVGVVTSLTNGSVNVPNGTIQALGTLGTVGSVVNLGSVTNLSQVYNAGTLQGGTINTGTFAMTAGTLSPLPTIANVTYGTHGTTGVTVFGTLAGGTGSGAGTEIFITSLSLSIPSTGGSQDVSIGWGSNAGTFQAGTGLLVRGNFPPGGGIQKQFYPPVNSGTQAQLMYVAAGAGTVDISVTYFITTSSL